VHDLQVADPEGVARILMEIAALDRRDRAERPLSAGLD